MSVNDLENLPLSHLFAGPLLAAIDASIQLQEETVGLLREEGFTDEGDLETVTFEYTTEEFDEEAGRQQPMVKQLEIPLLLFLTLPNLQITTIEEEFSAKITQIEDDGDERRDRALPGHVSPFLQPRRLNVAPAKERTTFDRQTKANYDVDVRMTAELENETRGMDLLERAASTAVQERIEPDKTAALREQASDAGNQTRLRSTETDDDPR